MLLLLPIILLAQIPHSEKLPPEDIKPFREEIQRVENLLNTAGDKPTVLYVLARTWAAGGDYKQAFETLQKVAELRVGLDPSNDQIFKKLKDSREYRELLERIRSDTPPVSRSTVAFRVDDNGLIPEGIAY